MKHFILLGILVVFCLAILAATTHYLFFRRVPVKYIGWVVTTDFKTNSSRIMLVGSEGSHFMPVSFSGNMRAFAVASKARKIGVFDNGIMYILTVDGKVILEDREFYGIDYFDRMRSLPIVEMSLSPTGNYAAIMMREGSLSKAKCRVYVRHVSNQDEEWKEIVLPSPDPRGVSLGPEGKMLAFATLSRRIYVHNVKTGANKEIGVGYRPRYSMDGTFLSWIQKDSVVLYDFSKGSSKQFHVPRARLAVISPDNNYIAVHVSPALDFVGSSEVQILSMSTGAIVKTFSRASKFEVHLGWITESN